MASLGNRIVVLIDMDCFFCQVETRLNTEFEGKPLAVVQYNPWRSGGIIAVNYEARDFGVTRHMRGDEAKEKCPDIVLATVPCLRGKADTSRYRSAGREVIDVLKKNCNIVERASVDEAYLDITQIVDDKLSKGFDENKDFTLELKNSFIVGFSETGVNDEEQRQEGLTTWLSEITEDIQIQRLAIAGAFVEYLRKEIYETTKFRCSAGISFNKILAKLACGLHKPNRQTILPASAVPDLYGTLPVKKVRNLGGKLGDIVIDSLKCNVMADLLPYSLQYLQNRFDEKTGMWLYNIARGVDNEPVTPRLVSKSIGACKQFRGKQAIVDAEVLKHWLGELAAEVCERLEQDLEENERRASLLTVSFQYYQNKSSVSQSRSYALSSYKVEKIAEQCFNIVSKATHQMPISFLGLSAGKFIKAKGSENFMNFFKTNATDRSSLTVNNSVESNSIQDSSIEVTDNLDDDIYDNEVNRDNNKDDIMVKKEEVNKPKPPGKVKSRRSSPCEKIQKTLRTDNFKKSFFMNLFKEKQQKYEDAENLPETCDDNSEDYIPITECEELPSDENNTENEIQSTSKTESMERDQPSCASDSNEAFIQLQEIFPDLNDIDPSVVQLLPSHLQQEAKKFLKMSETHNKNSDSNKTKNKEINKVSKGKVSKLKTNDKKSNIHHFFIKTDVNNDNDDNFKKCPQCDQLILVYKLEEHNDYHVAQNLQKEINQISDNDESRKRKIIINSPNHLKKRFSDEIVNDLPKTKSISSFFQ